MKTQFHSHMMQRLAMKEPLSPDSLLYSLKSASIQTENCGCLPEVYPETPRNSRKGLLSVPVNVQLSIAIQRLLDLFFLIL